MYNFILLFLLFVKYGYVVCSDSSDNVSKNTPKENQDNIMHYMGEHIYIHIFPSSDKF